MTLLELMIVMLLMAILSGLSMIGVDLGIRTVKRATVQRRLDRISLALEKYKQTIGEYPPDFSDHLAVMRHVKKRWPRSNYAVTYDGYNKFCDDIAAYFQDNPNVITEHTPWLFYIPSNQDYAKGVSSNVSLRQSRAAHVAPLIFWLGGLPDVTGTPSGFSLDPTDPILGDRQLCEEPFYVFDPRAILLWDNKQRQTTNYPWTTPVDMPKGRRRTLTFTISKWDGSKIVAGDEVSGVVPMLTVFGKPLVYFTATDQKNGVGAYAHPMALDREFGANLTNVASAGDLPGKYCSYWSHQYQGNLSGTKRRVSLYGVALPYAKGWKATPEGGSTPDWYEPNRYQLIYTGDDGLFGDWDLMMSSEAGSSGNPYQIRIRDASNGKNGIDAAFRAAYSASDIRCTQPPANLSKRDDDNVVNFTHGGTISSEYE